MPFTKDEHGHWVRSAGRQAQKYLLAMPIATPRTVPSSTSTQLTAAPAPAGFMAGMLAIPAGKIGAGLGGDWGASAYQASRPVSGPDAEEWVSRRRASVFKSCKAWHGRTHGIQKALATHCSVPHCKHWADAQPNLLHGQPSCCLNHT